MGTVDYLWLTSFCFQLILQLLFIEFNIPFMSFGRYSGEIKPARVLDTLAITELRSIGGLPSKVTFAFLL